MRRQDASDRGKKLADVQNYFSAAFDRVSHSGILYKLRDVGVGDAVFDVFAGFLSDKLQRVVVDGIRSENVRVVSGVPHGSVLDPLLFLLYTSDLPMTLENTLVGIADDSTFFLPKFLSPVAECQLYHLLIVILLVLVTGANAGEYWLILLKPSL